MSCPVDITDKVADNKVPSETLAINTKRIRELTRDLKAATDCETLKLYIELLGSEVKELTADVRKEAKKILDKYLPLLNIPLNPLKIIGWVKKLVMNTIMPQLQAYIKLMKQIIELVQAINEFIQAVEEVIPRLKQCAVDAINEEIDAIEKDFNDIKGAIKKEVQKIALEIAKEVNDLICQSGVADLVNTVKDAVKLTEQLVDEIKTTKDLVNDGIQDALNTIGTAGSAISGIAGVPFNVDTSSPDAFVASVNAGHADDFQTAVEAVIAVPPPINTDIPSLIGNTVVGQVLTANVGIWTGNNITYSYSWYRDDQPIYGANSSTYTLTTEDTGYTILCSVSADNPAGGDIVNTTFSSTVTNDPPVCSSAPSISGTANVGETLTVTTGTWSNSPTYNYQWVWFHTNTAITGANTSTYVIQQEDGGQALGCVIIATSSGGQASNTAGPTSIIPSTAVVSDIALDFGTF